MADPQTPGIHLTQPAIGGDGNGVWPALLNTNLTLIDRAVNGVVSVSIPDTNISLVADGSTSDQSLYAVYQFTGALTATRTITLPSNVKIGFASNGTTGGHSIILSAGGVGALTIVPDNTRVRFEVDGSNNVTSPVISCSSYSAASSGHIELSGGIILQWMSGTTLAGSNPTISFPLAFPTGVFAVSVTSNAAGSGPTPYIFTADSVTTTGANVWSYNASGGTYQSGIPFYLIAIGW